MAWKAKKILLEKLCPWQPGPLAFPGAALETRLCRGKPQPATPCPGSNWAVSPWHCNCSCLPQPPFKKVPDSIRSLWLAGGQPGGESG